MRRPRFQLSHVQLTGVENVPVDSSGGLGVALVSLSRRPWGCKGRAARSTQTSTSPALDSPPLGTCWDFSFPIFDALQRQCALCTVHCAMCNVQCAPDRHRELCPPDSASPSSRAPKSPLHPVRASFNLTPSPLWILVPLASSEGYSTCNSLPNVRPGSNGSASFDVRVSLDSGCSKYQPRPFHPLRCLSPEVADGVSYGVGLCLRLLCCRTRLGRATSISVPRHLSVFFIGARCGRHGKHCPSVGRLALPSCSLQMQPPQQAFSIRSLC